MDIPPNLEIEELSISFDVIWDGWARKPGKDSALLSLLWLARYKRPGKLGWDGHTLAYVNRLESPSGQRLKVGTAWDNGYKVKPQMSSRCLWEDRQETRVGVDWGPDVLEVAVNMGDMLGVYEPIRGPNKLPRLLRTGKLGMGFWIGFTGDERGPETVPERAVFTDLVLRYRPKGGEMVEVRP
jgi:hypothetical protein